MKRIFFIKSRMHKQGGLEKYLDRLARLFANMGHEVSVLTSTSQVVEQGKRPYAITSLMKPCSCSWLHILLFDRAVRAYLQNHSADVVFGFDRHFLPLTHYRAGNGCHRAYLAMRGDQVGWFQRALLWLNPLHWVTLLAERSTVLHPSTHIICNSDMVKGEFVRYYPDVNKNHLHTIHNGVEWSEFEEAFRSRSNQVGTPHILFVGNEWRRKGVEQLLRGLALVNEPFHCTIVGKEKRYRYFQQLVTKLQLQDKVELRPYHESSLSWYQRADILAIPSLYDPFANVTVEALAMGLFVVSSSSNGGSEVVVPKETGLILESLDPMSMRNSLNEALCMIRTQANLKESIREKAQQFDFKKTLQAYKQLVLSPCQTDCFS